MRTTLRLLPIVLAACGGDVTLGGPQTLVRVDPEPSGINCDNGGVAIHTGVDGNGNGFLDDKEITSTQYVCNGDQPVQCDGGNILTGEVAVTSDDELAELATVNCVDGDLLISGITGDDLPALALSIVTGDIVIAGNQNLTSLAGLSGLTAIGDTYLVQGNPGMSDLTALAHLDRVRQIRIVGNNGLTDLHGLEDITTLHADLFVTNNANLASLSGLDNLTATSRDIFILSNPTLTSIAALDHLQSVLLFDIEANSELQTMSFGALEQVSSRFIINNNSSLTSFTAPVLKSVGDFTQFNADGALTTVELPTLITSGPVFLQGDPSLTLVDAPNLAFTTGDVQLVNVPLLATAHFEKLNLIGGALQVKSAPALASLATFSHVTILGGGLVVDHADGLHDFTGLGSVTSIEGDMQVTNNAVISSFTGLDALTEISGALTITSNPMLPVTASNTFAGRVTVHGKVTIRQ